MSNDESKDKDEYFQQLAEISNAMVAAHGRDFAIGTLVLAARFVAEHAAPAPTGETADIPPSDRGTASHARAVEDRI